MRKAPRASIGFSMFPASIEPSVLPAPTTVCSSSMKVMIWPSDSVISLSTDCRRSSNSPRYLAPATIAAMSIAISCLPARFSGTSPSTIRCAKPSTIAVFPTPGSPISTGLFLRRLANVRITRRISSSLPITGSSLPALAVCVRSCPKRSRAWLVFSGVLDVTREVPLISRNVTSKASRSSSRSSARDRSRCSVERYSSLRLTRV